MPDPLPGPTVPTVVILDDRRLVADGLRAAFAAAGLVVSDNHVGDVAVVRGERPDASGPTLRVEDFASTAELVAAVAAVAPSVGHVYAVRDGSGGAAPALTPRERTVLEAVGRGESARDIADVLGISPRTVERHKQSLAAKLGTASHAGAVARSRLSERTAS